MELSDKIKKLLEKDTKLDDEVFFDKMKEFYVNRDRHKRPIPNQDNLVTQLDPAQFEGIDSCFAKDDQKVVDVIMSYLPNNGIVNENFKIALEMGLNNALNFYNTLLNNNPEEVSEELKMKAEKQIGWISLSLQRFGTDKYEIINYIREGHVGRYIPEEYGEPTYSIITRFESREWDPKKKRCTTDLYEYPSGALLQADIDPEGDIQAQERAKARRKAKKAKAKKAADVIRIREAPKEPVEERYNVKTGA